MAAEDTEGGFGITIPKDVAEYLWLKNEGFIILHQKLGDAGPIVPIRAEDDGRIAVAECLERLLRAMLSEAGSSEYLDESGKVKWNVLEDCGVLLRFKAGEPTSETLVEKILVITDPKGKSIRIRMGEELANELLVLKGFEFLEAEWLVEKLRELGFSDGMRNRFMELYGSAMALREDELYKLAGSEGGINDACGRLGEAKTTLFIAEKKGGGYIVELRDWLTLGGEKVELDIVTTDALFDTKYWNEETFRMTIIDASETLFFFYRKFNKLFWFTFYYFD